MAWVNVNRLAVGYSDGSIALWSVHPNCLISRHAIHHTPIIDMASGYPTMPYLIASNPMGGTSKLVDLRAPSNENTEVPFPAINVTPHLMSWSEHLLGFFTMTPTSNVLSTAVAFMHSTHYPVVRRVYTGDRLVSCIAVGRTHPFLLVGSVDGSIWAFNPQYELIHARRKLTDRIKVLQHEHRPPIHFNETSPAHERGASRILQGFMPEKSLHARSAETKAQKKKAKAKKAEEEDGEGDDASGHADPTKGILHEPLTRITAMAWNPNPGFGCWAAAAMGSGVVRVMDLGLDP
jgi:transcription factor C subunit 6